MKVFIARPRGFCAGVARAVESVDLALKTFGPPIYVRHAIVHNQHVVNDLEKKGAVFVESLSEIPKGSKVIFSAHGVSPQVREGAKKRSLDIIDATCPLVTKVHLEAIRFAKENYSIVLIGHKGHVELKGTAGEAPNNTYTVETEKDIKELVIPDKSKVAVLTQTTLSVNDARGLLQVLRKKYPKLKEPPKEDICYATTNRQIAVKSLTKYCDVIFVIGDPESSNSNRLREAAEQSSIPAYLIQSSSDIKPEQIEGVEAIGVTAGASAPEQLIEQVIVHLQNLGARKIEEVEEVKENMKFPLPYELSSKLKK
ncbi:4-hydroxy-3-methylbut-2-enyl diphosphate reductase [Patescibacteria group bacterium]|nr:4-hydroxy-3-methylbut-2-enyl diphosphate reductase [Patescibacteria group bacterium]MBU1075466.1 4-hydroxy-3-methylbut-2-enyl diphosphate reductase [Patescibacteria group bacterium]MBU1951571.1 4-hydroxy-3-methylbut-2-enyl diphosphate reductase [Patescibacteria group bacterium]MBU2229191.1 4-hydroxy-3-methylbut-2-enyl diphosphate reductase [Patescibacteria group bacterium]